MIELIQVTPCTPTENYLSVINAIFNGLQMLLLTWMGQRMGQLVHTSAIRLKNELERNGRD
jgi:hypothetical protein